MAPTGRLHFLDSLRGLAALYVVLFHVLFVPSPAPAIESWAPSQLVNFGGTGVFLFFLISGFSLSLTLPRHDRTDRPVLSYGLSRFFRIAPLFYAALASSVIGFSIGMHERFSKSTIALDASFLFNLVPGRQEGIVWASWTIGVEMLFYVAFMPLVRQRLAVQLLVGAATVAIFLVECVFAAPTYAYFSFLGYFPLFLMGMWAFALYDWWVVRPGARRAGPWLIVIGLAVLGACAAFPLAERSIGLRLPIGVGYAALLIGCGLARPAALSAMALRFYGKISYSVYLLHAPMVFLLGGVFGSVIRHVTPWLAYPACALIAVAAVTPPAYLAYRLIEVPGEQLGRRLIARFTQSRATTNERVLAPVSK